MFARAASLFSHLLGPGSSQDRAPPLGDEGRPSLDDTGRSLRSALPDGDSPLRKGERTGFRKSINYLTIATADNEEGLGPHFLALQNKECGVGQKFIVAQAPYLRKKSREMVSNFACRFYRKEHGSCEWRCRMVCAVGQLCKLQVAEGIAHNDHRTYSGETCAASQYPLRTRILAASSLAFAIVCGRCRMRMRHRCAYSGARA
jgi:hypothetical protein